MIPSEGRMGPWNIIWKLRVPPKIKLFMWQFNLRSLPTLTFLQLRGIVRNTVCKWCGEEQENLDHRFYNCQPARFAWKAFSKWLDFNVRLLDNLDFESAFRFLSSKVIKNDGGLCLTATLWVIWLSRNELMFKNIKTSEIRIERLIKSTSFSWGLANNMTLQGQEGEWNLCLNSIIKANVFKVKKSVLAYWFKISKLLGFIDGSWKMDESGQI